MMMTLIPLDDTPPGPLPTPSPVVLLYPRVAVILGNTSVSGGGFLLPSRHNGPLHGPIRTGHGPLRHGLCPTVDYPRRGGDALGHSAPAPHAPPEAGGGEG